uniref:Integrase catalytic domain-containing protein n=1 Tax=Echinostoma caproni TaxID=27848 RepID=A0A183AYJ6_9TREM
LNFVSGRHVLTPPRHPQSNGAAENYMRTLKSAIASLNPSTFDKLDRGVDNFLMQYRNAVHSSTGHSPAKLFKSRVLRTNLLRLESAEVIYHRGNDLRPSRGIVLDNMGQRRNYIPVQMSKTVQKNTEDYPTKPAVITEDRSFIQDAADKVIVHELRTLSFH